MRYMRYLRPCFCYKMIEHNLVRLHKPIIIWECTKVEDARRPDPPTELGTNIILISNPNEP